MIRFPTELTDALEKAKSDPWIDDMKWSEKMEGGEVVGYRVLCRLTMSSTKEQVPTAVWWNFNLNNEITEKMVAMTRPTDYDTDDLARAMLDFESIEWIRRESSFVDEKKSLVGDLVIQHRYLWKVPKSLKVTLKEELDIRESTLVPSDEHLDPSTEWKIGYHAENPRPNSLTETSEKYVASILKKENRLQYKSAIELLENKEDRHNVVACDECDCGPCVWIINKQNVVKDNYSLLKDSTNRQRRFFAYKQLAFALHGRLGKGQRRELPECVVEGVRAEWPDKKRQYTGFRPK